jgi:hypothetical protein
MASKVTMLFFSDSVSSSAGIAVISFDLPSTSRWPSARPCSLAQALTRCSGPCARPRSSRIGDFLEKIPDPRKHPLADIVWKGQNEEYTLNISEKEINVLIESYRRDYENAFKFPEKLIEAPREFSAVDWNSHSMLEISLVTAVSNASMQIDLYNDDLRNYTRERAKTSNPDFDWDNKVWEEKILRTHPYNLLTDMKKDLGECFNCLTIITQTISMIDPGMVKSSKYAQDDKRELFQERLRDDNSDDDSDDDS